MAALLIGACGSESEDVAPIALQYPSPMRENTRMHERLSLADSVSGESLSGPLSGQVRIYSTTTTTTEVPSGGPLVFHFHGSAPITSQAIAVLGSPAALVSVNLGSGSSAYERPFLEPGIFSSLVDSVLARTGLTRSADRRIFLSSFSAGYGAVRAILREEADRIDGVLLLDGLHASYVPEGRVLFEGGAMDSTNLEPFTLFARRAIDGEKAFLFTHSEIFPGTYASTTETADFLLDLLGSERTPVIEWGPVGMQLLSRARKGRFQVLGFAGNSAPDHIDHFHGLPAFLNMLMNQ
jgi:hypothetical protein